jgi:uncharacterized membrane protein YfcA
MQEALLTLLADPWTWAFVGIGFVAQLCDGALGMGFGAISSAVLAVLGVPREVASASINGAKLFTGAASSASHIFYRNVDLRLLLKLAIAGMLGGWVGAALLARFPHGPIGPLSSVFLLGIGVYIIRRAWRAGPPPAPPRHATVIGAAGGLTEALAGVWGPLVTSSLVALGVHPRFAVGSASVAETFVAAAVFATLVDHIGLARLSTTVLGLLAGALLAAPLAARLLREIPRRPLMLGVGVLVIVLSLVRLSRDLLG